MAARIRALRAAVERDPSDGAGWGRLAMSLHVHGLEREALPAYREAASLEPGEFRWPYYAAIALASGGGSEEALAWFERARSLRPAYAPLGVLEGEALFDAGRYEEAARAFGRALQADSALSHAHLGLARLALARGNAEESRRHLERAVATDRRHGEARGLLAEAYRRLGEPERADLESRKAEILPKVTPLADPVYRELAKEGISSFWRRRRGQAYLQAGLTEAAIGELRAALEVRPDAEAHDNLGFALHQAGARAEAIRHFRAALELRPTYAPALVHLGTALFEAGSVEEAISYAEEATRRDPALAEAWHELGLFRASAGRARAAAEAFRQGLASARYDLRIAARLAWLLAASPEAAVRDGTESVRVAEEACELTDYRFPELLDVLAAAYAETGRFDRAIETARAAGRLATAAGQDELAARIGGRLALYEAGRAYREPGPRGSAAEPATPRSQSS